MGGGSWNGGGDTPAHPSAWCKAQQGWVTVENVTADATLELPDVKASRTVHRLWSRGEDGAEYFLLENRQQTGYDELLPSSGLLVWHVDASEPVPGLADLLAARVPGDVEVAAQSDLLGSAAPGSPVTCRVKLTPDGPMVSARPGDLTVGEAGPSGSTASGDRPR